MLEFFLFKNINNYGKNIIRNMHLTKSINTYVWTWTEIILSSNILDGSFGVAGSQVVILKAQITPIVWKNISTMVIPG